MEIARVRDWVRHLAGQCASRGLCLTVVLPALRATEWYPVARGQFLANGPAELVETALHRMFDEAGLPVRQCYSAKQRFAAKHGSKIENRQ